MKDKDIQITDKPNTIPVFYRVDDKWTREDIDINDERLKGKDSGKGAEWNLVEGQDLFDVYLDGELVTEPTIKHIFVTSDGDIIERKSKMKM